jgi:hypothetical protein
MSSLRFTFGVEFEFSVATLTLDVEDPLPADIRTVVGLRDPYLKRKIIEQRREEDIDRKVKKSVAQKLRDAGLPTVVTLDPDDDVDNSYPWAFGHWAITTDSSIRFPVDEHDWWSIEVNSPPYIFCKESLDAVLLACRILTSSFRININESCGLHVHVGNGDDNFSFETLRNLMGFYGASSPSSISCTLRSVSMESGAAPYGPRLVSQGVCVGSRPLTLISW